MQPQATAASAPSIHPDTRLGAVTIRIANLDRALEFYEEVLGFQRLPSQADVTPLSAAGEPPLVRLMLTPGARPMPRNASGLFHFAILVPTRADLGRSLRRLAEAGVQVGQADHLVSEALYISDPDGNGIEIYRDRPRSAWTWANGHVQMATEPLDLRDLLAEGGRDPRPPSAGLAAGTRIGHVHLQVSHTQKAAGFYHGLLGFDITAEWPGAVFASAGGYHHHIGLNSWASRGAPPAPAGTAGLESFEIEVPLASEQARLAERLTAAAVPLTWSGDRLSMRDPWNIEVVVALADP